MGPQPPNPRSPPASHDQCRLCLTVLGAGRGTDCLWSDAAAGNPIYVFMYYMVGAVMFCVARFNVGKHPGLLV